MTDGKESAIHPTRVTYRAQHFYPEKYGTRKSNKQELSD